MSDVARMGDVSALKKIQSMRPDVWSGKDRTGRGERAQGQQWIGQEEGVLGQAEETSWRRDHRRRRRVGRLPVGAEKTTPL